MTFNGVLGTFQNSGHIFIGLTFQLLTWSKSELGVLQVSRRNVDVETLVKEALERKIIPVLDFIFVPSSSSVLTAGSGSESSQGRGGIFHFTIPKTVHPPD
jgi:hypothetical protein